MKRTVEIDVEPTPAELAIALAKMDADQQAMFFNVLASQDVDWKAPWCFQLQYLCDSPILQYRGRDFMRQLGEYAFSKELG